MLDSGRPVAILDVRWSLGRDDGSELFLAGHLPGAVYVDLDSELSGHASPEKGRHPLPELETLELDARRWGIRKDEPVVVYDDAGALSAARAWWVLRWAGIADVRILDGGLGAWRASGGDVVSDVVHPEHGDVHLTGGQLPVVSADAAAALAAGPREDGILIDARAPERFAGTTEPIDPKAGHIPGAVNIPTSENLTAGGQFLAHAELRQRFIAAGVDVDSHIPGSPGPDQPVAVYCGSGVTAAHEIAALASIGVHAALYPGSWSQWSYDADRPVATDAH